MFQTLSSFIKAIHICSLGKRFWQYPIKVMSSKAIIENKKELKIATAELILLLINF